MKNSTLTAPLTGDASSDRGLLTHLLLATHLPLLDAGRPAADLVAPMLATARGLVAANINRQSVVAAEAVSLAYRYMTTLAMTGHRWRLLGVEVDTGRSVTDMAWVHETGVVCFDEIKTSRTAQSWLPPAWLEQVARHNLGGEERHGAQFVGTRLLPLSAMRLATFFPRNSEIAAYKIDPLPGDPIRPCGGA